MSARMKDIAELYERDFVLWSEEQAAALRSAAASGTNLPLDWQHLAEEIDSLGKSLRSELRNRLATIIEHLLKLHASRAIDPRDGWMETVERERVDIELLIKDNPSLRSAIAESLSDASYKAKRLVKVSLGRHGEWTAETQGVVEGANYSADQVLGSWWPDHMDRGTP